VNTRPSFISQYPYFIWSSSSRPYST